jgi:hypothetical protein
MQTTPDEFRLVIPVQATVTVDTAGIVRNVQGQHHRSRSNRRYRGEFSPRDRMARQRKGEESRCIERRGCFDECPTGDPKAANPAFYRPALPSATGHNPFGQRLKDVLVLSLETQVAIPSCSVALRIERVDACSVIWGNCCEKAIALMAMTGVEDCKRVNTLVGWHKHLRMNNTLPPSPSHHNKNPLD